MLDAITSSSSTIRTFVIALTLLRVNRDPYRELRVGFTAAVSHELRTPLARLLALIDDASLPGGDPAAALAQARAEVERMDELVDDVLFLSELETGREVVSLGSTQAAPLLREICDELAERSDRAGVGLRVEVEDESIELPLRPRMLRVVIPNLARHGSRLVDRQARGRGRGRRGLGRGWPRPRPRRALCFPSGVNLGQRL